MTSLTLSRLGQRETKALVGRVAAKRKKATEKGAGNDKKANVNDAVKMHTGKTLDDK